MNTPNGVKTEFRNLKVVINEANMKKVKDHCKKNGLFLGAFCGKAITDALKRERQNA